MKMKNMLIGGMSLALVACISIGGTLAYLTATDGPKTNTFEFANGLTAELEENADANSNGNASSNNTGIAYTELVPGVDIDKDVTATFTSDVDAYFFVKIEPVDKENGVTLNIKELLLGEGWKVYDDVSGAVSDIIPDDTYGEYVYEFTYTRDDGEPDEVVANLFDTVFVNGNVETGAVLEDIKISVKAIQKDGFADVKAAYGEVEYQGANA